MYFITVVDFVLKYNCFNFCNLFFLQVHGITLGTKVAPKYANLFMANLEFNHVFNYPPQPLYYHRYIDGIFFIWNHSLTELEIFLDHLNSIHPTIKFTKNISETLITYLDLDIYICENQYHSKTHFKTTNTFSYLHGQSNHPPATFKGVHKGENIRILRNTTEEPTYLSTMSFINNCFEHQRYPPHLTTASPISFDDRDQYLEGSTKKKTPALQPSLQPMIHL